jgi:hypothetical protein
MRRRPLRALWASPLATTRLWLPPPRRHSASQQPHKSSNWNGSDIINGDPSHATWLFFGNNSPTFPPPPVTYDLTSNTFSNVYRVEGSANNVTLLINSSDTAGIGSFETLSTSDSLVTAASTLDLSNTTVNGFRVSSTNGLGTTFTVKDLGTALQIAGGPGHDTLIAQGFTLTADQRAEIFATASIETITDPSGTYNAAPASPPAPPPSPPTSSRPIGTTADMILHNNTNGAFEIYNLGSNAVLAAAQLGPIGSNWQLVGLGGFFGTDPVAPPREEGWGKSRPAPIGARARRVRFRFR